MNNTEYKTLTYISVWELDNQVENYLANGWTLYGDPSVTYNGEFCIYTQTVIRHDYSNV